jgi:hypothetical protein
VLITLGIIGIVAALTLPTLHKRFTKSVLKNQIKREKSLFAQNYKSTVEEIGSPNSDNYEDFNNTFLNKFKIARICNGNGLKDKCVPEYEGLNVHPNMCPNFSDSKVYNTQKIYVTIEGVIIIPYELKWRSLWLVDVNGMKGPNKAGWDLFTIIMDNVSDSYAKSIPYWSGAICINQVNPRISGSLCCGEVTFKTLADW